MRTSKRIKKNTALFVFLKILFLSIISTLLIRSLSNSISLFLLNIGTPDLVVFILDCVFYFVLSVLIVWLFCRFLDQIKLSELGIRVNGYISDILKGFLIAMILVLAGTGIIIFTNHADIHFFTIRFEYLLSGFVMIIFSALTEEIIYRGYILNRLMTIVHKNIAIVVSSLIFSGMHLFNPNVSLMVFVNIFLAGVLLGLLYTRKMNLWLPVSFHIFWNFLQSLLGYNISGGEMPSIFILEYDQANLINGGEFGFENSLVCGVLLCITIMIIIRKQAEKKQIHLQKQENNV